MLENILRAYHCHLFKKKKNLLFPVVGVEGGGVLESIPLPYYISFTPHLKLVTFGRISFPQSQFSHFQFMYLPYKAFKKVILKWIDSFDGEFSHFKNTTYQNLLPHKILEMQPPLQSIQSWKCGPTQRHISTSLLIENTFPQALTIDELRKTSLLQFLISQRITDIKILCIITIKLIRLLVFFFNRK